MYFDMVQYYSSSQPEGGANTFQKDGSHPDFDNSIITAQNMWLDRGTTISSPICLPCVALIKI